MTIKKVVRTKPCNCEAYPFCEHAPNAKPIHQVESPFPTTIGKTKQVVVDAVCTCKHLQSEHGDTLAFGHGACGHISCECSKFTWKAFEFAD